MTSEQINALLQQADVEGLIADGAPADEYESETEAIATALGALREEETTHENVLAIIAAVWLQSFNLSDTDLALRQPALESLAGRMMEGR